MNYELVFSEKFKKENLETWQEKQIMILKKIRMFKDNPPAGRLLKSSSER